MATKLICSKCFNIPSECNCDPKLNFIELDENKIKDDWIEIDLPSGQKARYKIKKIDLRTLDDWANGRDENKEPWSKELNGEKLQEKDFQSTASEESIHNYFKKMEEKIKTDEQKSKPFISGPPKPSSELEGYIKYTKEEWDEKIKKWDERKRKSVPDHRKSVPAHGTLSQSKIGECTAEEVDSLYWWQQKEQVKTQTQPKFRAESILVSDIDGDASWSAPKKLNEEEKNRLDETKKEDWRETGQVINRDYSRKYGNEWENDRWWEYTSYRPYNKPRTEEDNAKEFFSQQSALKKMSETNIKERKNLLNMIGKQDANIKKLEAENKVLKYKISLIEKDPEEYKRLRDLDPYDEENWEK